MMQKRSFAGPASSADSSPQRRSIERYRAQNQDPLLRRANELFTRFTLGSFVELFVDVDERGAGLLIGRQRDRVLKRVPEMSKGTREQLFLALRVQRSKGTSRPLVPFLWCSTTCLWSPTAEIPADLRGAR
jgi:uncharacterized protein YhaN